MVLQPEQHHLDHRSHSTPIGDGESGEQQAQVVEDALAPWLEDRTFWNLCVSDVSFTPIRRLLEPDFNAFLLLIPAAIVLHLTVDKSESIVFLCKSSGSDYPLGD